MNVVSKGFGTIMMAREGDLIETLDGNIFDVKGLVHPHNRIIAFIRFTPDPRGERKRNSVNYRKVYPLQERYALLREKFPQYLVFDPVFNQWLCEVPTRMVRKHYQPIEFLKQLRHKKTLDKLERQALELATLLRNKAGVDWNSLGVSGSPLAGLHTSNSDIDLIVYGSQTCRRVHRALADLIQDEASDVKSYDERNLKALFDFRSKDTVMTFEDFVRTESRKVLQGKFHDRDYFIRCVKGWNETTEVYGSISYESMGDAVIDAVVSDDSEAIFTPCRYGIRDVHILSGEIQHSLQEIVSFRGRFCEQARRDERIIARGMVERLEDKTQRECFRLILGNKPSDFMILAK